MNRNGWNSRTRPRTVQVVGPLGLLYVFKREFAVTYPHDNKVSLIGTDEVTTDLVIVVRHTGKLYIWDR